MEDKKKLLLLYAPAEKEENKKYKYIINYYGEREDIEAYTNYEALQNFFEKMGYKVKSVRITEKDFKSGRNVLLRSFSYFAALMKDADIVVIDPTRAGKEAYNSILGLIKEMIYENSVSNEKKKIYMAYSGRRDDKDENIYYISFRNLDEDVPYDHHDLYFAWQSLNFSLFLNIITNMRRNISSYLLHTAYLGDISKFLTLSTKLMENLHLARSLNRYFQNEWKELLSRKNSLLQTTEDLKDRLPVDSYLTLKTLMDLIESFESLAPDLTHRQIEFYKRNRHITNLYIFLVEGALCYIREKLYNNCNYSETPDWRLCENKDEEYFREYLKKVRKIDDEEVMKKIYTYFQYIYCGLKDERNLVAHPNKGKSRIDVESSLKKIEETLQKVKEKGVYIDI